MDLWSLACTLFELRLDVPVFDFNSTSSKEQELAFYLALVLQLLGAPGKICDSSTGLSTPPSSPLRVASSCHEAKDGETFAKAVRTNEERRRKIRDEALSVCGLPCMRLSVDEATDFADLLEGLWRWDPEERITARVAQAHRWFYTEYDDAEVKGYKQFGSEEPKDALAADQEDEDRQKKEEE